MSEKHVILTLEYDLGDCSMFEQPDSPALSTDPKWWSEYFYQSDVYVHDMEIVAARVEVKE